MGWRFAAASSVEASPRFKFYERWALMLVACAAALSIGVSHVRAADDDTPPSGPALPAAQARHMVNDLIGQFKDQKKRVTAGMIQQAIGISIAYGAPAYNAGDHAGCAGFYVKTAEDLVAAFPNRDSMTAAGRAGLDDLQFALDRSHNTTDPDRIAWSMRFAFDKNQLNIVLQVQKTQALVGMGEQYFKRGQVDEARDALQSATTSLAELDGESIDSIPIACRFAPLALANTLFAQQKYKDAVAAIEQGLVFIPQWPALEVNLKNSYPAPADYDARLAALEDQAHANPKDSDLQFLLGYQYWFTGRRLDAKDQFDAVLKLDPAHVGAKQFLDAHDHPAGQNPDKPRA